MTVLTWRSVEEVGSVQDVSVLDVGADGVVLVHVAVVGVLHLPRLHHLQPLRVMPAEFLQLDLLGPLLIVFLMWRSQGIIHEQSYD